MAQRKRIGLFFSYSEDWIAGSYYIMNLVYALKTLPQNLQPKIIFYVTTTEDEKKVREIDYNCYQTVIINAPLSLWKRIYNVFHRKFRHENRFLNYPNKHDLDIIFPYSNKVAPFVDEVWNGQLYWIPDFQEYFLPYLFDKNELEGRAFYNNSIIEKGLPIILSSNNSYNHFKEIYKIEKYPAFVLNFAVTHPSFAHLIKENVLQKFGITRPYFFSPNQFWAHKNQIVILEALKILRDKGSDILIVFSGKEWDYRNPNYFSDLKKFVKENDLENNVLFLGFIDRNEQLLLMNESECVIQPSLFEGWSTLVEDAKALNKLLIASNLEIHKEQITSNVTFFNPNDPEELSSIILSFLKMKPAINYLDYSLNIKKFGEDFNKIVNLIIANSNE
jgi:glycosyltransferase involved in cell wall biosynthesis